MCENTFLFRYLKSPEFAGEVKYTVGVVIPFDCMWSFVVLSHTSSFFSCYIQYMSFYSGFFGAFSCF